MSMVDPSVRARWSTVDRAYAGFIATIRDLETGAEEVIHRAGFKYETGSRYAKVNRHERFGVGPREMLAELCDEMRAREGDWRFVCISTPETIFHDIQGRASGLVDRPEHKMLGAIGAMDRWWKS